VVTNTDFWSVWQPDELYCALLSRSALKHATVPEIAFETYKKRKTNCLFSTFNVRRKVFEAEDLVAPISLEGKGKDGREGERESESESELKRNSESTLVIRRSKRLDLSSLKPYLKSAPR